MDSEPRRDAARYRELLEQPQWNDNEQLEIIDFYLTLVSVGEFESKD